MQYEQLKKNTVSAKGQLKSFEFVTIEPGEGLKVMFVGNSITLHGPNLELGWHGNWGMAASEKDKDYVHVCMQQIRKNNGKVLKKTGIARLFLGINFPYMLKLSQKERLA